MADWIEILKSFLYDGQYTFGITIWWVMGMLLCVAVLLYSFGGYRGAFGRKRLKRSMIARLSIGSKIRFKIVGEEIPDDTLLKTVKQSVFDGLDDYDSAVFSGDWRAR